MERVGTFVRECEKEQYLISFAPQANINEEITEISVEDISLSLIKMRDIRQEMKAVELRQILYSDTLPICYIITALLLNGRYNPCLLYTSTIFLFFLSNSIITPPNLTNNQPRSFFDDNGITHPIPLF